MGNATLGLILKTLRQNAQKTQQQAAEELGLRNKSTLASWEGGKSEPDIGTFLKLCSFYSVKEADLLAERIGLKDSAYLDFALPSCEDRIDRATPAPDYAFCPFCGRKLPQSPPENEKPPAPAGDS